MTVLLISLDALELMVNCIFLLQNEETSEMVLFIDRVFPQMFRHYYFVAESTFGKTEHKVFLERGMSILQGVCTVFKGFKLDLVFYYLQMS